MPNCDFGLLSLLPVDVLGLGSHLPVHGSKEGLICRIVARGASQVGELHPNDNFKLFQAMKFLNITRSFHF